MTSANRIKRTLAAAEALPICLVLLLTLTGCPGGPDLIDPKGSYPTLGSALATRDGRTCLVVYTATFTDFNLSDDAGTKVRHTGYTLYSEAGQKIDYVRNFLSVTDTQPTPIELEPGKYLVKLDNPEEQPPVFKVVVSPGSQTTVRLPK